MDYYKHWTPEDIRVLRAKYRWTQADLCYLLFGKFNNSTISSLETEVNNIGRLHCLGLDVVETKAADGYDFDSVLKAAKKKDGGSDAGI